MGNTDSSARVYTPEERLARANINTDRSKKCLEEYRELSTYFRANQNWASAAEAAVKVAELELSLNDDYHEAITFYRQAATMHLNNKNKAAYLSCQEHVIAQSLAHGLFLQAARVYEALVDHVTEPEEKISCLDSAYNYYKATEGTTTAQAKVLHRLGDFLCTLGQFADAAARYGDYVDILSTSRALTWHVRDVCFKRCLCLLAEGQTEAETLGLVSESYHDMRTFVQELARALKTHDVALFENSLLDYNEKKGIMHDEPYISLMAKIKSLVDETPSIL